MTISDTELYKKHRPKKFANVLGQDGVIKTIEAKIKIKKLPHAILFVGPSGTGKTTLARIIAKMLKCSKADYKEVNAADDRGIEMVRTIKRSMMQAPMSGGSCKVYCIDEAHKMSPDAQGAFLKPLEDTPSHVYFILCTTDPQKILDTIKTRCTQYKLKGLTDDCITKAIKRVVKKEGVELPPKKVMKKLVEAADGSGRRAIVLLDALQGMEDEDDMLGVIGDATSKEHAFAISRALMNTSVKWGAVAKILFGLKEQDVQPESLRYMIMGYATSALIKDGKGWGDKGRAYCILESFRDNFYDSKFNGLVAACFEVVMGR